MDKQLKCRALKVAQAAHLFDVTRRLTRGRLPMLCYHGIAIADEHRFRPGLFVTPGLFESRLDWLVANGFTVLPLDHAIELLEKGEVPRRAVVITFDDGFYGAWLHAVPMLKARGLPATIYVTSYYMLKGGLVFRLAVQYMFWKTRATHVDVSALAIPRVSTLDLAAEKAESVSGGNHAGDGGREMWRIIEFGEKNLSERERRQLLADLGRMLDVDYGGMLEGRGLGLMTPDEVKDAARQGIDIQLHTHRHCLPRDEVGAAREIGQNRDALEPIVRERLSHFCYPSGICGPEFVPHLQRAGIRSATTCAAGMNTPGTPRLFLNRFLDAEDVAPVEFEAEMMGALELARRVRRGGA